MPQPNNTKKEKSPWLGVILNAMGFGYIYSGNIGRFFLFWAIEWISIAGGDIVFGSYNNWAPKIVVLIAMVDVYSIITKYNQSIK